MKKRGVTRLVFLILPIPLPTPLNRICSAIITNHYQDKNPTILHSFWNEKVKVWTYTKLRRTNK